MKKIAFKLGKSKKTWGFIGLVLGTIGLGTYVPFLTLGESATEEAIESHCDDNPNDEACQDLE